MSNLRERERQNEQKKKISNWPDWLVSDSDKNGGWLLGSIQSEKKMLGKRKRKYKEVLWFVVVIILSSFIIDSVRVWPYATPKRVITHIGNKTSGRGQLWRTHQSDLNAKCALVLFIYFLFFFSSFLLQRPKRISSGKTMLKRWLSPIIFLFFNNSFRDLICVIQKNIALQANKPEIKFLLSFRMWSEEKWKFNIQIASSSHRFYWADGDEDARRWKLYNNIPLRNLPHYSLITTCSVVQ